EQLFADAMHRLRLMRARGTTTVEIKSGYGLWPEAELKQLRVIAALRAQAPGHVYATALAHVVPPELREQRERYIDRFCSEVLDVAVHRKLAQFCDVFVE